MIIPINIDIEFIEGEPEPTTVALEGKIIRTNEGTFCEDVKWNEGDYTSEQNEKICEVAFSKEVREKLFKLFQNELADMYLESNLP